MSSEATILPGARVRAREGIIGTVERLDSADAESGGQPTSMVVRSDDGRWRYRLPLFLVGAATQGAFYTVVHLAIGADELTPYIAEELTSQSLRTEQPEQPQPVPGGVWMPEGPGATLRLPLAAEELTAVKRPLELGTIHLRKGVRAVEQRLSVPLYREEAIVERIPADQYDAGAPVGPHEVVIPVVEEQLAVEKRTVVTECIRLRKNTVTERREIRDTVRQEYVEVTERRGAGAPEVPLLRELPGGTDGSAGADGDRASGRRCGTPLDVDR